MKVAICYSGNLRTYEHCVLNHSKLIDSADVYISTWDEIKFSDSINDNWHHKINLKVPDKISEDYIVEKTPSNFNIKSIKIDNLEKVKLKSIKENPVDSVGPTQPLSNQYYKIKDSYDLLNKSGEEYDFVIRLRPDITIDRFYFEKDKIIFNNFIWYNLPFSLKEKSINEMIWISNMEFMKKACKIYDNIEKINDILSPESVYGESFCFQNILLENLLDHLKFENFNYRVVR
jgi:hypothetical protein